jgi:hypothetical protein
MTRAVSLEEINAVLKEFRSCRIPGSVALSIG